MKATTTREEYSWMPTKKTVILNTKLHLGFGFPCKPGTSRLHRLNDVRNGDKMKVRMMNPVLKSTREK